MRQYKTVLGAGVVSLTTCLTATSAYAQTPAPLAEWQYSSGIQLQRLFEPTIPTWQVEFGLGSAWMPGAPGVRRYRLQTGPAIDIRYKDVAFLSSGEGLGANLFSFRHISVGGAFTYDLGRSPSRDRKVLEGLGTIHATPEFKIFATTVLSEAVPLTIRMDVRKQLTGPEGYIGDIGAYMPMPGSSRKFVWFVGPTLTLASTRFMNSYFGVSHAQTKTTAFKYYKARGGLRSAGIGLSGDYFVTPHFIVNFDAAYSRLLGSAAQSPITQTPNEGILALALLYKF